MTTKLGTEGAVSVPMPNDWGRHQDRAPDIVLIMGIRTGALKGTQSKKKRQSIYLKVSLDLLRVQVSALTRRSVSNDNSDLVWEPPLPPMPRLKGTTTSGSLNRHPASLVHLPPLYLSISLPLH